MLIAVMAIFSSSVFAADKVDAKSVNPNLKKDNKTMVNELKNVNDPKTNMEKQSPKASGVICLKAHCTENIYCGYVGGYYSFLDLIIWQNELDHFDCSTFTLD